MFDYFIEIKIKKKNEIHTNRYSLFPNDRFFSIPDPTVVVDL